MAKSQYRTLLHRDDLAKGLDSMAERLRVRLGNEQVTAIAVLGGAVIFASTAYITHREAAVGRNGTISKEVPRL